MSTTARTSALALVAMVGANALGGLSFPAQKAALDSLPPATVTLGRNLIALAVFGALLFRGGSLRFSTWTRSELVRIVLLGAFAYGLPMVLGIIGVERSTAANGSLLILLEPAAIVLVAWIALRERATRRQLVGLLLGFVGALVIVLEGARPGDLLRGEHLLGNAILALHAFLWGVYTPAAKPISARHDPIEVCFVTIAAAHLVFVPALLLDVGDPRFDANVLSGIAWTVALGIGVSVAGTMLWIWSLGRLPAAVVAPLVFVQPLAGIGAGVLFLDERVSTHALVGGAIVALACALVVFGERLRPPGEIPSAPVAQRDHASGRGDEDR